MPDDQPFDAVRAAAELEAQLGVELAPDSDAHVADRVGSEIARVEQRLARESARELARRTRAVLLDFLAVLDDLERALVAGRRESAGTALLAGLELVERSFLAALARHGVSRFEALGERFDPA